MRTARALPVALLALAGSSSLLAGCGKRTAPNPAAVAIAAELRKAGVQVKADDPTTCVACHTAIVAEWQESMHARAHHEADPIYAGLRTLRLGKEGPATAEKCAGCHSPRDVASPESPVARTGVACAACHAITDVHLDRATPGAKALTRGPEGTLRGPHDVAPGTSPVHETGPALPALVDGRTICLACHAEESNKAGVTTCETGLEMARVHDERSCTSCHMPEVATPSGPVTSRPTHRSHAFLGPHRPFLQGDPGVLRDAVGLAVRFEGDRVVASLENKSAHAFPTGFPARMAVVVLRGLDAKGAEVWRNVRDEPMKDHPEAVLNQVFHDAEGKPTLAAFAVKRARDARLGPAEKRDLAIAVPADVVKVEATVKLWLVGGPAAKAIGVAGRPEAQPVDVVTASGAR